MAQQANGLTTAELRKALRAHGRAGQGEALRVRLLSVVGTQRVYSPATS